MYRRQRHRYVYQPYTTNQGHIKWVGADKTLCGKVTVGYSRTLTKYDETLGLCQTCCTELKRHLAEEYGIGGWA